MTDDRVPSLYPCAKPGCRRWSHFRFCPEHADDDQRRLELDRRRALVALDLWRDRVADINERLGIGRRRT